MVPGSLPQSLATGEQPTSQLQMQMKDVKRARLGLSRTLQQAAASANGLGFRGALLSLADAARLRDVGGFTDVQVSCMQLCVQRFGMFPLILAES